MTGRRILLVEDNEDLAELWKKYFSMAGFEVIAFTEGEGALASVLENSFAAVVCDYVLPDMRGTDVLDRIRARDSQLPFVLITGMRKDAIAEHVARAGCASLVLKPVSFIDLLNEVKRLTNYEA